ncbi:MAG: hypothetical protein JNG88_13585, partial [Phycisphaerales bacterium]|nr:hypothetical protein [Phycisphaerales bacterium]
LISLNAACNGGIVANPMGIFAPPSDAQPLRLPTAVAPHPDGRVAVLDGAHHRIVIFARDGSQQAVLSSFGDAAFDQPTGLRWTADGRFWLADGPNHRVLVGDERGALIRTINVPPGDDGRPADPTDVAILGDGSRLWVVDNENHRVLYHDVALGAWTVAGRLGAALGQFEYPWQLAALPNGDLVVSDVINARAHLLNPRGEAIRAIGSFGVELGQFFRPSGIAVSAAGEIWIADSVIGVVQVFRADGSFVDVVRDHDGGILRLDGPLGIAFDAAGALLVVEARANRVSRFKITTTPGSAALEPRSSRALPQTGQQSKACTLCHIDWLAPFSEGRDSSLMPRSETSREDPIVARAEMCISCHDGTVADSRLRVWDQHGHQTGITPPPNIVVPPHLPLVNNTLACRTCHSAHGNDAPQGDFRRAMLLRVPNQAAELCVSCHVDKTRGPRFGTHPTGGMAWPIPDALVAAGAKVGPNPRELTCQVCHTPHGAKNDHLLVLGTSSNQLCVNCHDQIRPGMFRDGPHAEHPLTAQVNVEQARAVQELGTKLGPNDRLICLSCHKLHHGKGERFLLADDLTDGQMCLHCHSQRREMIGSAHDLREKFPNERNRLGLTAVEGGPCSSCHLFHRYARQPTPAPGDAAGHCTTCHSDGQCAENKKLGDVNHPSLFCTECHNPHEVRHEKFLKARPVDLCTSCHIDQSALVGGPHDATMSRGEWCRPGALPSGPCLGCHRPHGDHETGLFQVAPAAGMNRSDGICVACHPGTDPARGAALALLHPIVANQTALESGLPLVQQGHDSLGVGCKSCHDPHAGWGSNDKLLRVGSAAAESLCIRCHADKQSILLTAHSSKALAAHNLESGACRPCHEVHGDAALVSRERLWPAELAGAGSVLFDGGKQVHVGDENCTGCHRAGGPARVPLIATHPNVTMLGQVAGAADLPLFDLQGRRDHQGVIACRTCHTPHGSGDESAIAGALAVAFAPSTGAQNYPAAHTHTRAFAMPNTCTNCHGAEALWRFLYFHDAARRAGPYFGTR